MSLAGCCGSQADCSPARMPRASAPIWPPSRSTSNRARGRSRNSGRGDHLGLVLAYVFSHRPADGVDVGAYEDALRQFHRELASASLNGFVESATFAVGGGYSDWYL